MHTKFLFINICTIFGNNNISNECFYQFRLELDFRKTSYSTFPATVVTYAVLFTETFVFLAIIPWVEPFRKNKFPSYSPGSCNLFVLDYHLRKKEQFILS
jgi:hypothetical protein